MARGLVVGLVQTPQQVVESPHLEERGFFVEMDHARAGLLKYPGSGFFIDGENAMASARPAPRLGEHNVENSVRRAGPHRPGTGTAAGRRGLSKERVSPPGQSSLLLNRTSYGFRGNRCDCSMGERKISRCPHCGETRRGRGQSISSINSRNLVRNNPALTLSIRPFVRSTRQTVHAAPRVEGGKRAPVRPPVQFRHCARHNRGS